MCEPVTLAALAGAGTYAGATSAAVGMAPLMAGMLGITTAQTVMQTAAGQEQARAQQRAINASHDNQQALQNAQALQINKQATEQMSETARELAHARAMARVAAGESGVSGQSVDMVERDFTMRGSQNMAAIEANRASSIAQNRMEARGIRANAQSKANTIDYPTWIGAGLKIAGAGADLQMRRASAPPLTPPQARAPLW
jgi:hypothetical protein